MYIIVITTTNSKKSAREILRVLF